MIGLKYLIQSGRIWQFEKEIFDSLKRKFLTVWKGNFWQFDKENFDSLKKENSGSLERNILTVWKRKIVHIMAAMLFK
jgi:hypothetical protein